MGIFGLICTTILITTNVTSDQIQTIKFVSMYLDNNENITLVSNPIYSWVFKYVYKKDHVLIEINDFDYDRLKQIKLFLFLILNTRI
jgi:hypothetical protein